MRLLLLTTALLSLRCAVPQCAGGGWNEAECRVQASAEVAQVRTAEGVRVGFVDEQGLSAAIGVVDLDEHGALTARLNVLGPFALQIDMGTRTDPFELTVHNVDPRMPALGQQVAQEGLRRTLRLDPAAGASLTIGATWPLGLCDGPTTLVAVGDVQTGPLQFERIIDALHDELASRETAGAPLLGLLLLGDLSESATQAELEQVRQILDRAPVPTVSIPGNHDTYVASAPLFNRLFGPTNVAFDACDTRVVMLDSADGSLAESIVGRLPSMLDSDAPHLVVGVHHPPYPGWLTAGWTAEDQAHLLLAELEKRDADAVLAGHAHRAAHLNASPVPEYVVGTGGANQGRATPDFGYLRLSIDQGVTPCFVEVPGPGGEAHSQAIPIDGCPTSP